MFKYFLILTGFFIVGCTPNPGVYSHSNINYNVHANSYSNFEPRVDFNYNYNLRF